MSAKPAPSLKRIIAHLKERSLLFYEDEEGHQYIEVGIEDAEQIIKALEARPIAEGIALAELRVKVEAMREKANDEYDKARGPMATHQPSAKSYPAGKAWALGRVLDAIDAQERAGAKAG